MAAESDLQDEILDVDPYAGEEFITERFCGVLKGHLKEASSTQRIELAFLNDLSTAFQYVDASHVLSRLADGLGARIGRHGRHIEARTGGDLGFAIIRPDIDSNFSRLTPHVYRRGLLAQAKLRTRETGKWGTLTSNQKRILPQRLEYLALLLYSYKDNVPGALDAFRWQTCSGFRLTQVSKWLSENKFPTLQRSDVIIKALGNARIGTDDQKTIDEVILPEGQPAIVLEITWPGRRPPDPVRIELTQPHQAQYVKVGQ
jgi:hypothetical protein